MKPIIIFLELLLMFSLIGCDGNGLNLSGRYTGEKDINNNFIILDTKTGSVQILMNDQLIEVPKENEISRVKEYPARKIPGMPVRIGKLRLKFRDGKIHYQWFHGTNQRI